MKAIKIIIIATAAILTASVSYGKTLTAEEIESTFVGNTYHWEHTKRSDTGKTYLGPDGNVAGMKNGESRGGSWEVKGNQLCFTDGKSICRDIESDGKGTFYLVKDGSKRVIKISKIEQGNTI